MDLYKLLCRPCKRNTDIWSKSTTIEHSEENWKAYEPCAKCKQKIQEEIAK